MNNNLIFERSMFVIVTKNNLSEVRDLIDFIRSVPVEHIVGYTSQVDPDILCLDPNERRAFQKKFSENYSSNIFIGVEQVNDDYIRLRSACYDIDYDTNSMDYHNVVIHVGDELQVVGSSVVLTENNSPMQKLLSGIGNPFQVFIFDSGDVSSKIEPLKHMLMG